MIDVTFVSKEHPKINTVSSTERVSIRLIFNASAMPCYFLIPLLDDLGLYTKLGFSQQPNHQKNGEDDS